jgi:tRNA nucleotidyltransferase (CCA-adding enzyme)
MNTNINSKIPQPILNIIQTLQNANFEAQIVGGSVRDLLLGLKPKDWDINTSAKPDQILALFPDSFYENEFGTVGVKVRTVTHETETTEVVEVTPYRKEGEYTDGRHPENVSFDASLEDDLKRRDFTVNAIAYNPVSREIFTPYSTEGFLVENLVEKVDKGHIKDTDISINDLKNKVIRAVGSPNKRFNEDFLRMLRAVRLSTQLEFTVESETMSSIIDNAKNLKSVSRERVRDELIKLLLTKKPIVGILMLDYSQLLNDIMPELLLGKGMKQTENHKYDVYGHLLRSMQHAADKEYSLDMRITALLHDIAKPHTCRLNKVTGWNSFHGHEVVGEKVSREILHRLKFPQEMVSRVTKLVRWHMFNSDPDQVSMSAVRRMIVNVSRENIWDLMNLRFCDRIGSGRPMEEPYRLRRYFAMIEEALTQATDLKMLKIDGKGIMEVTHETPGPRIGLILNALMGEVLEEPTLNTHENLVSRVTELAKLSIPELKILAEKGKDEIEEAEQEKEKQIRKKFKV